MVQTSASFVLHVTLASGKWNGVLKSNSAQDFSNGVLHLRWCDIERGTQGITDTRALCVLELANTVNSNTNLFYTVTGTESHNQIMLPVNGNGLPNMGLDTIVPFDYFRSPLAYRLLDPVTHAVLAKADITSFTLAGVVSGEVLR